MALLRAPQQGPAATGQGSRNTGSLEGAHTPLPGTRAGKGRVQKPGLLIPAPMDQAPALTTVQLQQSAPK